MTRDLAPTWRELSVIGDGVSLHRSALLDHIGQGVVHRGPLEGWGYAADLAGELGFATPELAAEYVRWIGRNAGPDPLV